MNTPENSNAGGGCHAAPCSAVEFQNAVELREALEEAGWDASDCSNYDLWLFALVTIDGESQLSRKVIEAIPYKGFKVRDAMENRVTVHHIRLDRTPERARKHILLLALALGSDGLPHRETACVEYCVRRGIPEMILESLELLRSGSRSDQRDQTGPRGCPNPDAPFQCRFPSCDCLDVVTSNQSGNADPVDLGKSEDCERGLSATHPLFSDYIRGMDRCEIVREHMGRKWQHPENLAKSIAQWKEAGCPRIEWPEWMPPNRIPRDWCLVDGELSFLSPNNNLAQAPTPAP